jgi:glutathione S-transferase
MTLKIYGMMRSRASRVVWLAEELGLPYEVIPVIQMYRLGRPRADAVALTTGSTAFLKINPNGLIPTIDDGGFVMNESLAITMYLAKKHGGALAPRDLKEDALMMMWALWAATEVEERALLLLRHRRDYPPEQRDPVIAQQCVDALRKPFGVLAAALGNGHVVGGRFTVADINTAEVMRYAQMAPELFAEFPAVKTWIDACQARPAFKKMMALREAEPA